MKKIWIIANWKSNKTIAEALDWVSYVGPKLPKKDNLKVVVCPTFSCLSEVKKAIKVGNLPLMVGSQDLSPFTIGAYTGEESASLLTQLIDLSILGHSERRKSFAETDEMVEKKFKQALENNITPLVCIQSEETPIPQNCNMVAYEPIWAISTGLVNTPGVGKADTPEDANKVAKAIRQKYGNNLEVIYGGSVNSQNVKGFITQGDIGGVLVGNASLNPEEFVRICNLM
ncbi:triosephosphate isomerase [Candidatus Roizmanbacteria bacterium]|nr:triosephosphate isomerase [Candidatus Roizmanbacteria bacterium]